MSDLDLKIRPCPVCGKKPTVWFTEAEKVMVSCGDCDVSPGVSGDTIKIAVKKWNTRKGN
jgi:hypothetical protein